MNTCEDSTTDESINYLQYSFIYTVCCCLGCEYIARTYCCCLPNP